MLGLATKLNWVQFDKKKLGDSWNVVSLSSDGRTFKSKQLKGTWAEIWKQYVQGYRDKRANAALIQPSGKFYTWSGTHVSK